MKLTYVNGKRIFGLSARTNNQHEMNPAGGKIPSLVQRFDESVQVNYRAGARVYSVYYDYVSDATNDYSILVGADSVESSAVELQDVNIQEGNYLVFSAQGQVPQIVIETWVKIWNYFASADCAYTRAYLTDFEFYKSQNEIEIHIGVK